MFSSVREIAYGVITSFSGAIGNIPPGWSLCDGSDGTPDLRDKFIVGAGTTYAVGNEGGAVNHSHAFTSDNHNHTVPAGATVLAGSDLDLTLSNNVSAGTSDSVSGLAPYYSLAYIMYIE